MDKNPHLEGTPDEFIEKNLGLSRHVAWKYAKSRKDCNPDDILSVAYLGLVKAYKGFNPEGKVGQDGKAIPFATYACSTIHGFIMTFLRVYRPIHLGRRAIDLIAKMNSAGLIGNETIEEIAIKAGMTIEEANEAVMASIAVNTDSMDREINADNGQGTLGDMIGKYDENNDEQEIVSRFVEQLPPRFQEIYKLHIVEEKTQYEVSEIMGLSQSYISRLVMKLMEMAQQFGKNERLGMYEGGNTKMATEGTKKMREEITKSEQFNIIGSAATIAERYGVSLQTVYAWKKHLADSEKGEDEVPVIKADAVKMETAPFPVASIPGDYKSIEMPPEEREAPLEKLNATTIDEHTIDDVEGLKTCAEILSDNNKDDEIKGSDAKRETKDVYSCYGSYKSFEDCQDCSDGDGCLRASGYLGNENLLETIDDLSGIVEPEPAWTPEYYGEAQTPFAVKYPKLDAGNPIEDGWRQISILAMRIRREYLKQAEQEFSTKLEQILGGMG